MTAMAIGCFAAGMLIGATSIVVISCIAVQPRETEPLTKEEWKAGLNQDMKDRGIHL